MKLIEKIHHTFAEQTRPKLMLIPEQMAAHEVDDVAQMLNRSWREINGHDLEKHFEFINWLMPEAFCYFIPAILAVSVAENSPDLIVVHSLINLLDRSDDPANWDNFFIKRFRLLNRAECVVIQEWIVWLSSCENISISQHALGRALDVLEVLKTQSNS